jgi:hypothetical protein
LLLARRADRVQALADELDDGAIVVEGARRNPRPSRRLSAEPLRQRTRLIRIGPTRTTPCFGCAAIALDA